MVLHGRVDGCLAVSRAFGDFSFKMRSDLSAISQKVTAEPDVTLIPRLGADDFILLACDGVWDVMDSSTAVNFIHTELLLTPDDLEIVCSKLVRLCLELGSHDNISVIIVILAPEIPCTTPPEKFSVDLEKGAFLLS